MEGGRDGWCLNDGDGLGGTTLCFSFVRSRREPDGGLF